ncbi:Uncharacterised protein [Mycobacteroides abscessus subsp. abscessus]|nr:Uncharacterised protein [Mycobacteroides abscessus subsp. abscessus]
MIIAIVAASMNSSIDGWAPEAMNSATVRPADSVSGKIPTPVSGGGRSGVSPKVIATMTPSVPSDPTRRAARSRPATPFAVARPSFVTVPSARTTVSPRT